MEQAKWAIVTSLVVMCSMATPAPGRQAAQASADQPGRTSAASSTVPTPAVKNDSNYQIGPSDVLEISVWKEANLSRTVPVRPDGKISLPLVNDVQAAGLTPMQLADSLGERLRKFITDPQVTVIVTQINSQRVYINGEVNRPGAYPLLPGMNVLQAITSAGGLGQFANGKKIYVLRTENGTQNKYPFNYKDVVEGRKPEQNILLKPGDTIIVP